MLSEGPWSERTLGCGDMYTSSCPLLHTDRVRPLPAQANSATEGERKGEITGSTVICRYDRFVDIESGLPADAARRALEEPTRKMSFRDELWNVHKVSEGRGAWLCGAVVSSWICSLRVLVM